MLNLATLRGIAAIAARELIPPRIHDVARAEEKEEEEDHYRERLRDRIMRLRACYGALAFDRLRVRAIETITEKTNK